MLRSWSKCILIIYSPRDAGSDAGSQPSLKEECAGERALPHGPGVATSRAQQQCRISPRSS